MTIVGKKFCKRVRTSYYISAIATDRSVQLWHLSTFNNVQVSRMFQYVHTVITGTTLLTLSITHFCWAPGTKASFGWQASIRT